MPVQAKNRCYYFGKIQETNTVLITILTEPDLSLQN